MPKGRTGLELGACFNEIVDRIETTTEALVMINWQNVITVLSAAVLIGAEAFGAAFAGGWAVASLFGFGDTAGYVTQTVFFLGVVGVMLSFVSHAPDFDP